MTKKNLCFTSVQLIAAVFSTSAYANECDAPLNRELKTVVESADTSQRLNAFHNWLKSDEGSSWSKSHAEDDAVSFLGSIKFDGSHAYKTNDNGKTFKRFETESDMLEVKNKLDHVKSSFVSDSQWQAYIACIGQTISGTLAPADDNIVILTLTEHKTNDKTITAEIMSAEVFGAKEDLKDWVGKSLSYPLTKGLSRINSASTITVAIATTLGDYHASSAPVVKVSVPAEAKNLMECDDYMYDQKKKGNEFVACSNTTALGYYWRIKRNTKTPYFGEGLTSQNELPCGPGLEGSKGKTARYPGNPTIHDHFLTVSEVYTGKPGSQLPATDLCNGPSVQGDFSAYCGIFDVVCAKQPEE